METGQPDETGKMGEEITGTLTLPRPKGRKPNYFESPLGCLMSVFFFAYIVTSDTIADHFQMSKLAAHLLASFCVSMVLCPYYRYREKKSSSRIRLRIQRGHSAPFVHDNPRIEVWEGKSLQYRVLDALGMVIFGVAFCVYGFSLQVWMDQAVFVACGLIFMAPTIWTAKSVFYPLLGLSVTGIQVGGQVFSWDNIEKVEVVHELNGRGAYVKTKWHFFGPGEREIAKAAIGAYRCDQNTEDLMIAFAARSLASDDGRAYQPKHLPLNGEE